MDVEGDGDGGLRLHLGCGTTTPAGWVNVDGSLGARLAQLPALRPLLRATGVFRLDWSPSIRVHDLRRPFPWPNGSAAGTGSSENAYATINSDGTVGSFGGATGSNTLQAVGGMNLYGASGVAYVDSDGVAHVMILAGDDVNSPGTKSAKVIFN